MQSKSIYGSDFLNAAAMLTNVTFGLLVSIYLLVKTLSFTNHKTCIRQSYKTEFMILLENQLHLSVTRRKKLDCLDKISSKSIKKGFLQFARKTKKKEEKVENPKRLSTSCQ